MTINKEATPKFIQINIQTEKAMTQVNNEIIASEIYNKLDKSRSADTNMNYDIIHDAILIAKEKHMPCKLVKFKKYKHKKSKWITQGLLKSIRYRDKLYSKLKKTRPGTQEYNTLNTNLKTYNTILKSSIQAAKNIYFETTFTKFKHDIRNTWKNINEIFYRKKLKELSPMIVVGDMF